MQLSDIFFHGDSDGCCCAAILADHLEKESIRFKLHPTEANPRFSKQKGFFLDLGGLKGDQVTPDSIVVDHHPPQGELPCTQHNPCLRGESWPASYETFRIFGRKELSWIAATGCQGDQQPIGQLVDQSGAIYGKLDFQHLAKLIDSYRSIHGIGKMGHVVELILKFRSDPTGFSKDKELNDAVALVDKEIARILSRRPKITGNLVLLSFKSSYQIKSQIANAAKDKWPASIVLISQPRGDRIKISLRENKELMDFSKVLPKVMKGLDGTAGGHPKASGGTISKKHFKEFCRRIEHAARR